MDFVNGCKVEIKCKFVPGSARLNSEICTYFTTGISRGRCLYAMKLGKCEHPRAVKIALEEKLKTLNSLERKSSENVYFQ